VEALERVSNAKDIRLLERDGHAAYLVQTGSGGWSAIGAQSGAPCAKMSRCQRLATSPNRLVVLRPSQRPSIFYDQWIVHQHFDPFRPFYRIRLNDAEQTIYMFLRARVKSATNPVCRARVELVGAVVHWIYFHTASTKLVDVESSRVVGLTRGIDSVAAGTWLGIVRMLANRAAGRAGLSPFRRWMRWHHLIGLLQCYRDYLMLSGWLSMDHGRVFSMGRATDAQEARLRGMTVSDVAQAATVESLRRMAPAAEITLNAIDDRAFFDCHMNRGPARAESFS